MKKMRWERRILVGIMTIALIVGNCYYYAPMKAEAASNVLSAAEIRARMDSLYDWLGGKYFNVGQTTDENEGGCGKKIQGVSHGCANCNTKNIVQAGWFREKFDGVSIKQFPSGVEAKSCLGFAHFAEWYIFKTSVSDTVKTNYVKQGITFNYDNMTAYARPGDHIRTASGHSFILYSVNSSGVVALDCNASGSYNCKVARRTIQYSYYAKTTVSIIRATNYTYSDSNAVTNYTLDVNPKIDDVTQYCGLDGYTFNVIIKDTAGNDVSGTYGANNVIDYCKDVPYGYSYEVKPTGNTIGRTVIGCRGTIGAQINYAVPLWTRNSYELDVNPQIHGKEEMAGLQGYTFTLTVKNANGTDVSDTYGASNVTDYCQKVPYGYSYLVIPTGNREGNLVNGASGTIDARINYATPKWIAQESTAPVISDVQVSNYLYGYIVTCTVTDNVKVARVQFPTWTNANGQDDLAPYWATSTKVSGEKSGNTYVFDVNIAHHNQEQGVYFTDIYAYDTAGNSAKYSIEAYVANYNLYLNPNGGVFKDGTTSQRAASEKLIYNGENWWDVGAYKPVREGYTFDGWYTEATGGTKIYGAEGIACSDGIYWTLNNKKYRYNFKGDLKVYAHWKADVENYNLYLNPNGGAFNDGTTSQRTASPKLIYKGENLWDVSANRPVREGYTFEGWYTAATGGTKIYGADGIACADGTYWTLDIKNKKYQYVYPGDLRVYAHWKADIVTISYDANGGTGAPQPQQKKPGDNIQISTDTLFRAGYFFDGWNTEADGSGRSYGAGVEYAGNTDVTLYAQWVENASYSKSMNKVTVSKIAKQNYTGSAITPKLTVKLGKQKLQENVDYTVSYANNVKTGKATVILTGIGEFIGTREIGFNIVGSSITKAKVTGITVKIYDGQEHKQNLTVKLKGNVLKENEDYEVSYSKNLKAGTATVKITGLNAFSGTIKKTFKIAAYNLAKDEAGQIGGIPKNLTMAYTEGGCRPEFDLTFRGTELVKNKDYTVVYKNNKAVGSIADKKHPTVVIKGKGNFKGTINVAFNISAVSVADARVSAEITEEEITVNDPEQMQDQSQEQSQEEAAVPAEQEEYGTTDGGDGLKAEQVAGQEEGMPVGQDTLEEEMDSLPIEPTFKQEQLADTVDGADGQME